jgi:class 3 adenylate cyclase
MGDGFLATFDGPARALECARQIVDDADDLGLRLRAGLHTGECERIGDDVGGMAVNIGARISALAGPGEVLLSSTVRDLVVGSNLRFAERGVHQLKGVPGDWALYALSTEDGSEAADGVQSDLTADLRPAPWQRGLAAAAQRRPRLTAMVVGRSRRVAQRRRARARG